MHMKGMLARKAIKDELLSLTNIAKADQFRSKKLKAELMQLIHEHTELCQYKRTHSTVYRSLAKADMDITKVHREAMFRCDFWAIFPEEGKYVMAAKFHQRRQLSAILMHWALQSERILK